MPAPSLRHAFAPVAVLTGASSGMGHATALAFGREGACLVLASRGSEVRAKVVAACELPDAQALAVPTGVTSADAMRGLADAAIERFGRIGVWTNNVGTGAVGAFGDTPVEAHIGSSPPT